MLLGRRRPLDELKHAGVWSWHAVEFLIQCGTSRFVHILALIAAPLS
jgi:hypothetical protein